jgi:hypothetical protein
VRSGRAGQALRYSLRATQGKRFDLAQATLASALRMTRVLQKELQCHNLVASHRKRHFSSPLALKSLSSSSFRSTSMALRKGSYSATFAVISRSSPLERRTRMRKPSCCAALSALVTGLEGLSVRNLPQGGTVVLRFPALPPLRREDPYEEWFEMVRDVAYTPDDRMIPRTLSSSSHIARCCDVWNDRITTGKRPRRPKTPNLTRFPI